VVDDGAVGARRVVVGVEVQVLFTCEQEGADKGTCFFLVGAQLMRLSRCHASAIAPQFLVCVDWDVPAQVRQALDLLSQWTRVDVEDALRMLCPEYTHPQVWNLMSGVGVGMAVGLDWVWV